MWKLKLKAPIFVPYLGVVHLCSSCFEFPSATQIHSAAVTASGTCHWEQDETHICLTAAFIQACAGICSTFSRKFKIKGKRYSLKLMWWCLDLLKVGCWVKIQPPFVQVADIWGNSSWQLLAGIPAAFDRCWMKQEIEQRMNQGRDFFWWLYSFCLFRAGISDCQLNKLYLCSKDTCLEFDFFPRLHKDANKSVSIVALPQGVRWTLLTYIWQNPWARLCTFTDTGLIRFSV